MVQPQLIQQPLTLPELESHLWEAANILRGSSVDRTAWKSYTLLLLFFELHEESELFDKTYGYIKQYY